MKKRTYPVQKQIEMIAFPVIMAPLHGAMIPVQVRELTSAQIKACGSFSLIETIDDKLRAQGRFSKREIVEYSETQRNIVKAALVVPTFDELMNGLQAKIKLTELEAQYAEISALLRECPRGPKRMQLQEELDGLRIWMDLILPSDFMAFIVSYALGVDKSDIKKVTEDMLLEAAYLAERGHDNPCDHLPGRFTEFMRDDINVRAWYVFDMKKEEARHAAS